MTAAAMLLAAVVTKTRDLDASARQLLWVGLGDNLTATLLFALLSVEALMAGWLLVGTTPRLLLVTTSLLFLGFTLYIIAGLIVVGSDFGCGCFGRSVRRFAGLTDAQLGLLRNMIVLTGGGILLGLHSRSSRKPTRRHFARTAGFSLIELMIVLVILVLLASMTVPLLSEARDEARRVMCLGNLRQAGLVTFRYAITNRDYVAREGDPNPQNFDLYKPWVVMIDPLYQDLWPVPLNERVVTHRWLRCPSLDLGRSMPVSYSSNGVAISETDPHSQRTAAGPTRLAQIRRHSSVIYLAEHSRFTMAGLIQHPTERQLWDNALGHNWPGHWDFFDLRIHVPYVVDSSGYIDVSRHGRFRTNVLYFDGRADTVDPRFWRIRDFDDGIRSHPNRRPIPRPRAVHDLPHGPGLPGVDPDLPVELDPSLSG